MPQEPQDPSISGTPGVQMGGTSNNLRGFIQSMVNIHASRENNATAELNKMLTAAHAGFPVDPNAVTKTAKRAGIPLMKPQDMGGLLNPPPQQGQPQGGQQPTAAPKKNELGDTINDPHAQTYNVKAITDVKQRQQVETNHAVDGMIRQAVTNHQLQGASEQQTLQYTNQLLELKQRALAGDPRAFGQLAKNGQVKTDVPTAVWDSYNPKQKEQYLEMSRGAESDAQKNARIQAAATHLIDNGAFTSPEAAYKAAAALADGQPLPADAAASMRPTSMKDMVSEVDVAGKLSDIGLSGTQIWQAARGANLTGLSNYFPKSFTTIQQQMMAVRRTEAGAAAENAATGRMDVIGFTTKEGKKIPGRLENEAITGPARVQAQIEMEKIRAQTMAAELDLKTRTAAQKNSLDQYKALVDLKRAKGAGAVSDAVMQAAEMDVASKFGVELEPVRNLSNILTGGFFKGTHLQPTKGGSTSQPSDAPSPEVPLGSGSSSTQDNTDPAAAMAGAPQ